MVRKRELTQFGKEVKLELLLRNQPQVWLIDQLKQCSGMYVDNSTLYKVFSGQIKNSSLEGYIRDILDLPAPKSMPTENQQ